MAGAGGMSLFPVDERVDSVTVEEVSKGIRHRQKVFNCIKKNQYRNNRQPK
jgi:hypothetical protein